MTSCHSKTQIAMSAYISYMPANLKLRILLKLEDLFRIVIFSSILTQVDDVKLKSLTNMIFPITNFPFLAEINVCQVTHYVREYSHFTNFLKSGVLLTQKLLE